MVPASRKQLGTVCFALPPSQILQRGKTEPTKAGELFAPLLDKPLKMYLGVNNDNVKCPKYNNK